MIHVLTDLGKKYTNFCDFEMQQKHKTEGWRDK